MTDDRSLERAARLWIEAGPTQAPDRAVERALLRIATTPQERDLRIPWRPRLMTTPARVAAAAVVGVLVVGGAITLLNRPGPPGVTGPNPSASPSPPATGTPIATSSPRSPGPDYSALRGRILVEHAGNAIDFSEISTDYHTDRRRFYWMDPATMTGKTAVEFLPGEPSPGKMAGDISPDQKTIVFQDPGDGSGEYLWRANLDGSGLARITTDCPSGAACGDWQPAFDPTGKRIAFVRSRAQITNLVIKDLVTGAEQRLQSTEVVGDNDFPEQPAWSPDGTKIAFGRMHWKTDNQPESGTISIVDIATDTTTVLPIPLAMPGDPHWSPDGSRILLTDGPLSTAHVAFSDRPTTGNIYTIAPDGTDLRQLTTDGQNITAEYTPDGRYILFFNNYFWMMKADGSSVLPVNDLGDDLSDLSNGFGYVGHWIDTP
jgi:Tol biopolymer transport system component